MLKKIATNTFSQILSKALTAFLSIFLIWVLTNYLSTGLYWEYNKLYNYLSIFAFLADLGLYTITIREISKHKENSEFIIWNALSLRFILWIFIIFLAIWIALLLPSYNNTLTILWVCIVSIFTFFSLLNSSVLSFMQAYMKIEFSLFSAVFGKIINFLLILIIAFLVFPWVTWNDLHTSFLYILIAWLIWIFITFILNFWYVNKFAKVRFLFDLKYMKYLFFTSLPYWVSLFLSVVYFKVDIILLSLLEPKEVGNISIALYSLPMKIIEVLMVLGTFYLNSILPLLSEYFKENLQDKIKNLLNNSFRFLVSLWILTVTLWLLFKDSIIKIIATPDYLNHEIYKYTSWDIFSVVLFVLAFYFISAIFNYIFISSKNEKKLLYINIFITLFNIVWNIIMIPKYSFYWAWIVTLISQILFFILVFYFSREIIKFKIDIVYTLKLLIFSIIFYFSGYFILNNFSFWLYFDFFGYWILFTLIYSWFLFLMNKKLFKTSL